MKLPLAIPIGATAQRPTWSQLPATVRDGVQTRLGAEVVAATTQNSGFTPGFASRVRLADGRRYFVKAADRSIEWLTSAYEREAEVLAVLPAAVPAPRVRHRFEAGRGGAAWFVLVFEDIAGRPPSRPWTSTDAATTLAAVERVSDALTPAPSGLVWGELNQDLLASPLEALSTDPLTSGHVDELQQLVARAGESLAGDTLVHSDLRDDNVILTSGGEVWICDWNWPTLGPVWADAACVAIAMIGDGLDPGFVLDSAPTVAAAEPEALDSLLASLLAYFVDSGAKAPAEGSPHIRAHQRWYAGVITGWLGQRLGW